MGWFWGPSDGDKNPPKQDPLRNLDPSLRDFLSKESPVKYSSSSPQAPHPTSQPQDSQAESRTTATQSQPESVSGSASDIPRESLYQDGRYAHLWSSYRPQTDVENEVKSDAEKIQDVIEGYKERKAEIGRAALENCALEQWDVNECFRSGGWQQRLSMCRTENRKFERCYLMQAKFLKALGYMSTFDRPQEVDEKIQMHADTLYHRMMDQEAAVEAAKAEGLPIPSFPPVLSTSKSQGKPVPFPTSEGILKPSDMPEGVQERFKKRLEGLSDEDRDLEERAIKAEISAGEEVAGSLGTIYQKQEEERRKRKEQGRETIGDKVTTIFGFR